MSASYLNTEESPVISSSLSNQRVTGFAEDAQGYIWISTFRGLNRYNGYDFHQYYCTDDSLSLPDNQLNGLFYDSQDRLWALSVNGAAYYTTKDQFHQVQMKTGLNRNGIQLVENSKGKLFLNQATSIAVFDEEQDAFVTKLRRNDRMDLYNQRLYIDKEDHLWAVCGMAIREYDTNTLALKDSIIWNESLPLSYFWKDDIWMYGNGEFKIFSTKEHKFLPVPDCFQSNSQFRGSVINQIYASSDHSLEFYTHNGTFVFLSEQNRLVHQSDAGFPVKTNEFIPSLVFKDSKGNLWLGSQDQGFTVRYIENWGFNANAGLSALFQNKTVPSVINDGEDNLWIATRYDGVYRYNTATNHIDRFDLSTYFPEKKKGEADAYTLYIDKDGYLWMLISSGIVAKFQYQNERLTLLNTYKAFMPLTLYQDKEGTMWVGTYSDLLYTLPKGATELHIQRVLGEDFSYTSVIKELKDGTPLALTWREGIQKLNTSTQKLEKHKLNSEDMQLSVKRSIFLPTHLLEDSKGRVWIGTVANGLLCYTPQDGHIKSILGIPCTDICSMEEDTDGNIWISTMNGLSKYNPEENLISNFNADDGIGGNQFQDRASTRLSDGTLVFGGNHGLTVFNPKEADKTRKLPVYFEDLRITNQLIHPSDNGAITATLSQTSEIRINYDQNSFGISFAALDYSENGNVRYAYKMEGLDKYWIDAKDNREAFYSNLAPNKYIFRVRATNNDGSIIEGENKITVKVSPAPWFSWWAWLIYVSLFLGTIYTLVRSYLHIQAAKQKALQAEREKEHELHVNQMNMNFFANVSHEFRTPLTIISGPIEQLCADNSINGEDKHLLFIVQRSVRRMLRLVNQMMDFHKLENDTLKLEVKSMDAIGLLQQFTDLFTINARDKDITLNLYGLEDKFMMWVDADKLEKITTNLLGNAFKFTPAHGKINFIFDVISREEAAKEFPLTDKDTDSQYVKISVEDTGKGIPEEQRERIFDRYYQLSSEQGLNRQGTGIGLYYAKSLVTLHHGYIKAEPRKENYKGTVFSFILPVNEGSYTRQEKSREQIEQDTLFPLQEGIITENVIEGDNRRMLLIVDDDTEVVHYLKTMLSGTYHVLSAFDAETGLKLMQEKAPDLVVSDVVMGDISGYEFCKQIKENLQLCHIPVILVTAKSTIENQIEGLNSGADAYVLKPFDPAYLKALIHSLLQNREKARQILVQSTQADEVPEEVISPQDKAFMNELYAIMENELSNPELDVTHITELLHISRTKLYYKIKGLTGENPSVFFRVYKLNRAAEFIKEGKYNMSEIADMTGFATLSHFSSSFKKQFGVAPSEYK